MEHGTRCQRVQDEVPERVDIETSCASSSAQFPAQSWHGYWGVEGGGRALKAAV